jgi:hypothetical protein
MNIVYTRMMRDPAWGLTRADRTIFAKVGYAWVF